MAGSGWSNPFPLRMGGGPTPTDLAYRMLRSAVGKGGASRDENGLEARWRQARARGLAALSTLDERAALQALPNRATDGLPYYERLLRTVAPFAATEQERREIAAARFVEHISIVGTELEEGLQAIDARYSVSRPDPDATTTTKFGRRFQDLAASEPYGGPRKGSLIPNYTTQFLFTALLDTGSSGAPSPADLLVILRGREYAARVLPTWYAFQVVTSVGFHLDTDPLDYTALSP